MATVLLAYEFGAGLGHLTALIAVGKRLVDKHRLVFALPGAALGVPLLRRTFGNRVEILEGPLWPAPTDPAAGQVPTDTLADVLRLFGFGQRHRLGTAAQRWIEVLRTVSPRLIVADFAPALRIANGGRIPTVIVGNGYAVPPAGMPLPPLRPWKTTVPTESRAHEQQLLATVNEIQAELSGPPIKLFADLFQGESTFVCTLAEFDPYGSWRATAPSWPLNIPFIAKGKSFAERQGAAAFCYLAAGHPALRQVLAALSALDRPAEIYVEGADPQQVAGLCAPNVWVHGKPADFADRLPEASLLIHHAGLGTAYAGLAAGTPQLVLPLGLEHAITSRGLRTFKVAEVLPPPMPNGTNLAGVLKALLCEETRQSAALKAADEIARRRESDPEGPVVAACQSFLSPANGR